MKSGKKHPTPKSTFRERPQDINRAGRKPNNQTFGEYLRAFLEQTDENGKRQIIAQMVDVAATKAKHGSFQFWDALMNRAYGKPVEHIETTQQQPFDASKLSDAELAALKALLEKAKP